MAAKLDKKIVDWIVPRLAGVYNSDDQTINSCIMQEGYGPLLQSFFGPNGANMLLASFVNEKLTLCTDTDSLPKNAGMLVYVIRTLEDKSKALNYDQDLAFGTFGQDHVSSLVLLLQNVFNSSIEKQNLAQVLSESQVNYFLGVCRRFVDNLQKCGLIVESQLKLNVPTDGSLSRIPADLNAQTVQKFLSDQPEQLQTIENAVASLCNQIELFLVDSDKVRIEDEDTGPETEQIFWRARMACYNHVQTQMKQIPWINSGLQVLKLNNSSVSLRWQKVKQRIQEGTNEAKDNLKYLTTITDIMQPLYSNQPGKMSLVIKELIETVRMTHQMAKYYGSRDNMTTLLVKISNQMIKACRAYIKDVPEDYFETEAAAQPGQKAIKKHIIYDRQPKDLLHRLGACITLNTNYQQAYNETKTDLMRQGAKPFDFSEEAIFGNFDLFCARLKKIADIVVTKDNFSSLEKTTVPGLEHIIANQNQAMVDLKVKPYDVLMHRHMLFEEDYKTYKASIDKEEKDLQAYINRMFDDKGSKLQDLINVMTQLGEILNRPGMKDHLLEKYRQLLERYHEYLTNVNDFFDQNYKCPPIPNGFTSIGGSIAWAKILAFNIQRFQKFFERVYILQDEEKAVEPGTNFDEMDDVIPIYPPSGYQVILVEYQSKIKITQLYNTLKKKLDGYQQDCIEGWVREIQEIRMSLQSTVLVEHPKTKRLYVNFDTRIAELCHEVKLLQTLNVPEAKIPESAKSITLHEEQLSQYRDQLIELIGQIEALHANLHDDTRELLQPLINKLNKKIQPLLHTVCWTSMNLPDHIAQVQQQISMLTEVNNLTRDILVERIGGQLQEICGTSFIPLPMRQSEETYVNPEKPYLEACCQNINSYKRYIEKTRPHRDAVVESIFKNSQFIAASTCEIVTLITSRYLQRTDDQNAQTLKNLVINTILQCFAADRKTEFESACQQDEQLRADPNAQRTVSQQIAGAIRLFIKKMHQRFINAVFLATERTIRSLEGRIQSGWEREKPEEPGQKTKEILQQVPDCLFCCEFELHNEVLRFTPADVELRGAFEQLLQQILDVSKSIPVWNSEGDFYDHVLHQLSPIVLEKDQAVKMETLKQTLNLTKTSMVAAQGEKEKINMQTDAAKKWEYDYQKSLNNIENTCLKMLDGLTVDQSVYQTIGRSRQLLKMVMAARFNVEQLVGFLNQRLDVYKQHEDLWTQSTKAVLKQFQAENPEPVEYIRMIEKYDTLVEELQRIPSLIDCGVVVVKTDNVKANLDKYAKQWKGVYAQTVNGRAKLELQTLTNFMIEIQTQMSQEIKDLTAVRKIMQALQQFRELEANFDGKVYPLEEIYNSLVKYKISVNRDEQEQVEQLRYNLANLQTKSVEVMTELTSLQDQFKTDLVGAVKQFDVQQKAFCAAYMKEGPQEVGIPPSVANKRLREFQMQYSDIKEKWVTYSVGERLFGLEVTEYPELKEIEQELNFYNKLYSLYNDVISTIGGYNDQLWEDLNFDDIQSTVIPDFQNKQMRLPKQMKDWPAYIELDKVINDFNTVLPLFAGMRKPCVKDRHWQRLVEITKCESLKKAIPDPEGNVFAKLSDIYACDPVKYAEDIEEICIAAEKQEKIEVQFNKVKDKFKDAKFELADHKGRQKMILEATCTTEIVTDLEEQQMILSSLKSNRFNKPFAAEINQWVGFLSTLDETLGLWLQVQQNWIYLEAVFASGDISRQLPQEAKRFSNIDKSWSKIMQTANQNPKCIDLTSRDDTLKSLLPFLLEELEKCQKSLSGYLETKRNLFPRFYFCSDTVLLEVLGQQSEPANIQNHLLSIFDSINKVQFGVGAKKNNIIAMFDKTGEKVDLSQPVVATGNIEKWLNDLIAVMQTSLKDVARQAAQDLNKPQNLKNLIEDLYRTQPAQITLLCIQIIWTTWCEQYFKSARDKRLYAEVLNKISSLMKILLEITRDKAVMGGARTNVETLITIHVHQQDVFDELTKGASPVRSATDFDWLKQTRFYWSVEQDTCRIQITDIDFYYSYEYLGINERLVITPLTDRCYITLAQAIGLYLGGAPSGPAGTGKTETVKDMGKSLGMFVVVFNCSDQMDYKGLGKIFRGIAQTGCFGDFDEFNRIELDVMSVAAQQISCILNAIKDKKKSFIYTDGNNVSLILSAAYFITMNPGYAGRQELLENLKALFRSVAMMVPDREIIMRVKLASAGFAENADLARKFFILYQLCGEQLSKQIHYDFGLRNILSVLRTCGQQLRDGGKQKEGDVLKRVLIDMNRSKLVDSDIPLFESLVEDLFRQYLITPVDHGNLKPLIKQMTDKLGIFAHKPREPGVENKWHISCEQLYETSLVRHGIMILGPTMAGKSSTIYTLAKVLPEMSPEKKRLTVLKMNPKAITAPQMFGILNAQTGDWTDGIFSALWRRTCKKEGEFYWIVLNGPVDAVWIENLNTVLDDNKTLTLANSDRIPMSKTLKLVFEVDSLDNASPATVSRAGMIYMSGFSAYGWTLLFYAWIKEWPAEVKQLLTTMLDDSGLLNELYKLIDVKCRPVFNSPMLAIIRQFLMLLTAMIYDGSGIASKLDDDPNNKELLHEAINQGICFTNEGFCNAQQAQYQYIANIAGQLVGAMSQDHLKKCIFFCLMWSFGAILNLDDRHNLQKFLQEDDSAKAAQLDMPKLKNQNDFIYNYFVNDQGQWQQWVDVVPVYTYPPDRDPPFTSILIPTVDNTCLKYLITKFDKTTFNTLLTGEAGSGKTQNIFTYLGSKNTPDHDDYAINNINFSSATTMGILQQNVESFVEKRQGLIYGPPNGRKGIVFIDEINIPLINEWGDQPTNELTRQIIEERGLYALNKPGEFHQLQDLTFIGAMPLPGGGRNDIPARLKSQFSIINVNLPAADQLDTIFSTIVNGHFAQTRGFSDEVIQVAGRLVPLTRRLWTNTKIKMLPTPAKFHYIFNLRDLSRIVQGFIKNTPEEINNATVLMHQWANECYRVLPDKFTNTEDIAWFDNQIITLATEELGDTLANEVQNYVHQGGENKYIYFADFMRDPPDEIPDDVDVNDIVPKIYEAIYDKTMMQDRILMYQKKYNEDPINKNNTKLDLVLFDSCIQHILRISRIIRTPRAHALLVGVGGSGKQSCAKIASYIAGYKVDGLKIERNYGIPQLDEDLKRIYKLAGVSGQGVSFIFTDNDIKDEIFLERINNILTMGELPSLFNKEEKEEITQLVRNPFKKEFPRGSDTSEVLWDYFILRAKNNLHVILCFSPVGEKFRIRSRKFPGLISGCTIDWFLPWTRQALEDVANKMFQGFDIKVNSDQTIPNLVQHFGNVHSMMTDVTQKYFETYRRQTFVTPKSYLSFLATFKEMYIKKREELTQAYNRLNGGLQKLENAAQDVKEMSVQLEVEEKNLKVAQVEVAAKMGEIEIKRKEASKIAAEVQKVVDECSEKARVVKYNTDIAEEGKAKAEPEKQAAEEALNSIEQSAINNLVKLDNPPAVIQRIFDCVMILLNEKIEKVSFDEAVIAKGVCDNAIKPSWGIASKIGKQNGFFQRLIGFEKDAVTDEQCELIRAYIERQVDLRDKTAAERAFKAVVGLHSWCGCLVKYHYIMNDFIPIQNKVIELNKQLAIANQAKAVAEGELAEKQAALDALQRDFDIADGNRKALQDKADKTAARLTAASSLIKGLSGERKRWGEQLKEIDQSIINLVGDVSLCAAFLSYCGPFNQQFRDLLIHQIWMRDIEEKKLPHTKNINNNIIPFLTNDAVIGNWRIKGLPTDDQSTQNALIVTSSSRYPLLIDPQGQAGIWIKQMYPQLKIVNQNHKMFRQIMEDCIEQGIPVLISDIEEELDPVLDPVLEKNYVTVGRGLQINFGNKNISFDPNFSLFITTKLPRPRYSPETYAKTSIIDFAVTFGGLEAQLLARTVNIERKELEEQRKQILQEVNDNRKKALDLEESLLAKLSASTGNLLDDDELIQVLQDTKKTTDEVNKQIAQAQQTEASINQTRENYMPVATRGSNIYFLITDMAMVSNMYQTSLKNFLELFDNSILEAPQSPIAQKRIESIKEYMTLKIFKFISRGLFEKDRVLFTLNLCLKIDMKDGKVTQQEFMCFIRAGAALDSVTKQKPAAFTQMDDQQWTNILALSQLQFFAQLPNQMTDNDALWRDFFNDESPEQKQVPEYESLNSKEGRKENRFKRLLLIRCMRDDRAMLAVTDYINECLGTQYTDTYTPNFDEIVANECSNQQPICFLLSLGSDPTGQLEVIARKRKIELKNISMGQGQEPQARRLITESIANGGWVIINNSHLSIKFMGEVENMIDDIQERVRKVSGEEEEVVVQKEEKKKEDEPEEELTAEAAELKKQEEAAKKANEAEAAQAKLMGTGGIFSMLTPKQGPHADFRLILTTEPHPNFPIGLLQKCIKLTNDLPSGMRAGLKRTYTTLTQDTLDSVDKPLFWLPLVYSIAYIHSTVIERKKFGPLGWCTKYEFGQHDFNASVQFLQSYLYALDPKKADIASQISYPTIRYMISEVHYGGRVTDDFDRRLMKTYAHEWISEKVMQPGFYYSPQAKVTHPYAEVLKFLELPPSQNPQYFNINFVRDAINKMSTIDNPMIFRMHPNAEITYRKQETAGVLDILLNMQPKEGGGDKSGMTREEIVLNKAKQILSKAPEDYNMKTTVKRILDNMAINIHTANGLPNPEKQPRPPLTVFLEQEIQRIQKVLGLVKTTLRNLDQAIAGTIIMTEDLQDALDCIYDARVPKRWLAISWDLNNLGLWLQDLSKRCGQYSEWLKYEKTGELSAFWLTGFFNPQGFLTSVKQKMARMSGWSLDNVTIVTTVMKQDVRGIEDLRNVQPAKKGAYVYGLFLEGAAWNKNKDILVDSPPKQLFSDLPVILFDAFDGTEQQQPTNTKNALKKYECPIYKTPFRTGLTYITKVYLPTDRDPNDWILKGCALLCQKD